MAYVKSNPKIAKKRLAVRAKRGSANFEIYPKKTNSHFYVVVYDCNEKRELFCFSTLNIEGQKVNNDAAYTVGQSVAKWCLENKISEVYFNKLHYKFHGRLASAAKGFYDTFNK